MKNIFTETVEYSRHTSSYFNLPANFVVLAAYLLPAILSAVYSGFAHFSVLILLAIAAFEKKSQMVKLCCLQLCFYAVVCNILLTTLSVLSSALPILAAISTLVSLLIAISTIIVFFCSLYRALRFQYWKLPWISDILINRFVK